jgi:hypothetical protein
MNPYLANVINGGAMIILSLWGYFSSSSPSKTAFIPTILGVILLVLSQGVKAESKAQAHAAVIITLLAFIALFKPLMGAMDRGDNAATIRIGIMLLTNLIALIYFVRSFIAARKARG